MVQKYTPYEPAQPPLDRIGVEIADTGSCDPATLGAVHNSKIGIMMKLYLKPT